MITVLPRTPGWYGAYSGCVRVAPPPPRDGVGRITRGFARRRTGSRRAPRRGSGGEWVSFIESCGQSAFGSSVMLTYL